MKLKITLLSFVFAMSLLTVKAQLLLDESFNYGSVADTLTNPVIGGANWKRHSGTGGALVYNSTSLTYTGYPNNGVGGDMSFAHASGSREDANRALSTSASSGSVYVSFLMNVTNSGGTTGDYAFHLNDSSGNAITSTFRAKMWIKDGGTAGTFKLGFSKGGAATVAVFTPTDYNLNQTYMVVVKYVFNTTGSADDSVYATLVTTGVPSTEPTYAIACTDISQTDLAKIKSVCIRQGTVGTGSATVDGIRVATSWADLIGSGGTGVTPPAAITSPVLTPTGKTTATLSWTKPASYVDSTMTTLVFLKQGSAVTVGTPTNNPSVYVANSNFALATSSYQADTSAKCILNNDNGTVSVSGLISGATYYALIYVVRNADSSYSVGVTGNFQTIGVPANVTTLSFVATGQTSASLSWTKPSGYIDSTMTTLVFVKATNAITQGTPTLSSNTYVADTSYTGVGTRYQNDTAARCVYNANGTSVNIGNLTLGTTYNALVYVVRKTDTTYSVANTTSGATFGSVVPPSPLLSIGLGEVASLSSIIQWKKNANYIDSTMTIVVYMKQGTSITQGSVKTPLNSITANTIFGMGSALASDSLARCIYKGDSSYTSVTGLQAGTNYALLAYVVRNTDTAYSTGVTTTYTTAAAPTAPTSLTFANRTSGSFTLNWNRGANYDTLNNTTVVFVKQTTAVNAGVPNYNATKYTANTIFATGSKYQNDSAAFCVFKGAGSTVTVSGLTSGANYYVLMYTIHNNDSVYSAAATANTSALLGQPAQATALSLKGTGISTATISWTKPAEYNNATYTTLIFVKKGIVVFDVPSGNTTKYTASTVFGAGTRLPLDTNAYCVFKADTNTVSISSLQTNSQYFASVYIVRDADSAYSATANVNGNSLTVAPYYTIGSINKVNQTSGVPDSMGVRATVRGVVYGANQRATGLQFVLKDFSGGTTVFIASKTFGYTVTEGDSVEVQGVVTSFRGLHEIGTLDTLIKLGSGSLLVQPNIVSKVDEVSENNLVKINNVKFITPPAGGIWPAASTNINVTNANNDTIVLRVLSTFAIAGKALPTTPTFNVIGLGTQFSTSATAPYAFNGYQLYPRTEADITENPVVNTDSLRAFDLLLPAANDTIVLTSTNLTDTVYLAWTQSLNSNGVDTTIYTFMLDTLGGDFSNPRFEMTTGSLSLFPLTKTQIYNLANGNGIGVGQLFAGIWEVKAQSKSLVRYSTSSRTLFILNDVQTGLGEVMMNNRISMYPNPTQGANTTIRGLVPHSDIVTLIDVTGKNNATFQAENSELLLPTANLTAGIYFVKVQSGNSVLVKKLIVQ